MLALLFICPFLLLPFVLIHSGGGWGWEKENLKVKNPAVDLRLDCFSKDAPSSVDSSVIFLLCWVLDIFVFP